MSGQGAIWSPEALGDIDGIWIYYDRVAGLTVAEKVIRHIADVVAMIEAHPLLGRAGNDLRSVLRPLAAVAHVIFYRVADNIPEIMRVLDGRQDIDENILRMKG